jgi:hypothetical protein
MHNNIFLWCPSGHPAITRLGIIEVNAGMKLSPPGHQARLIEYVQSLVTASGITQDALDKLMLEELIDRGFSEVFYRDLSTAGKDLVESMEDNLLAAGVLISHTEDTGEQSDHQPWQRPQTIEDWIKAVGLLVPAKVK